MERSTLFGFNFISANDHSEILRELKNGVELNGDQLPLLITPNVDQIVKCSKPEFASLKTQLRKAKYILPDGQPIVWVSKFIKGNVLRARLTGSDLFPQFWKQCQLKNSRVALFVPNETVGKKLKQEFPSCCYAVAGNIDIANDLSMELAVNQCLKLIELQSPEFLLIGIGFPKQELLSLKLIQEIQKRSMNSPMMLLLGASFEFHVGVKKRSPKILQRMGLEFAHRMFSEPKRMIKRYLIEDSRFLRLAFKEIMH